MKKIICLLLALVTVFVFVSCGEPCAVCVDDNGDGKCDVCKLDYVSPADVIFNMAAASNPTTVKTVTESAIDGVSYIGVYNTVIYDDGSFDYSIYLRPWGRTWEDINATQPGLLPYFYYDWYLPMLAQGESMPDKFSAPDVNVIHNTWVEPETETE